jgi:hypothetical protein
MRNYLLPTRDKILYETWEKYKSQLTLDELAGFFNLSLKSAYRIIKQQNDKKRT